MSNIQVNLPVPAGNGVGAAVDTSKMGASKTLMVGGAFIASVTIEISQDGVDWSPLMSLTKAGDINVEVMAQQMRVRLDAYGSGTPNVDVGADDTGGTFAAMNVPAANGNGTALDTRLYGSTRTVVVAGNLGGGTLTIQASEDQVDWQDVVSFSKVGDATFKIEAQYLRVTRVGVTAGAATVTIGASNDAEGVDGGIDMTAKMDGLTTNVYIDSINGDDGNDGLSATTALASIRGLYRAFPIRALMRSQIIVHLAGVGGFGASATAIADYDTTNLLCHGDGAPWGATYHYRGPHMVPVTPTTGPATAALDVVPVVAVAGGSANAGGTRASRFDFTPAPGWTVNDFNGKWLRVTRAGALVIFEAPIAVNAADSITVLLNGLAAAPDAILATDTVEIVEPGARFINTVQAALDFDQVRISGVSTQDADVVDGAPNPQAGLSFERVSFRTSPFMQGAWQVEFDRCDLGGNFIVKDGSCFFVGCQVGALSLWNASATGFFTLPNPDSATSPIVANRALFMELQAKTMIVGEGYGPASWQSSGSIGFALTPNGFDSLLVGPQSYLQSTGDIQGLAPVAGSLAGIRAAQGGFVQVSGNGTAGQTSVAGAGGDLKVGPAASAYVDYGTGVGDFEEVAGFAGNLQRFPGAPPDIGDASIITTRDLYA